MAADEDAKPEDDPPYNVYRSGGKASGKAESKSGASNSGGRGDDGGSGEEPEYSVYRGNRNPLRKLGELSPAALLDRFRGGNDREPSAPRRERPDRGDRERSRDPSRQAPAWRRVLKWVAIGASLWLLTSIVVFAISAQIQKGKLNDTAADQLGALPVMAASGQTILVMGTDVRPPGVPDENGNPTQKKCTKAAGQGDPAPAECLPTRADSLLLVRAGGGAFEKLSIPRDTLANVPGQGIAKINAAYANGGAGPQIETVEEFLGIDIDHTVIVDFDGFEDLIDAVGGVTVRLTDRFKSKVGGGAGQGGITLELPRGETTLDGQNALVYARTRKNLRDPSEDDLDRARRQQQVLDGLKGRLTSPLRLPYNFFKGPFIAWSAPKAMVTDMGALTLPQLALSAAIGGDSSTTILGNKNSAMSESGITIPVSECEKAVRKFLGKAGPRTPVCSPSA